MNRLRQEDTRPAYRGGGYGFPKITGAYGAGRRRVYWEREGGLIPTIEEMARAPGPGPERCREEGISQDTPPIISTVWQSLLAGLGLGVGFAIVHKLNKGG